MRNRDRMLRGALASLILAAGLLTGCGAAGETAPAPAESQSPAESAPAAAESGVSEPETAEPGPESGQEAAESAQAEPEEPQEGKVLNIYCGNLEFQTRVKDHYPGYEEVDAMTGKIGDVDVVWTITPFDGNAYQDSLDEVLPDNGESADPVDLFVIESEYAYKYVNAEKEVTEKIADLGITEEELKDQFPYTKDAVTDGDGNLRALTWQCCPGALIYNREAAKAVLGSDEPEKVQEAVKDWDAFRDTAARMKEAGYQMTASAFDSYRVFVNHMSEPWVKDGEITEDQALAEWSEMEKTDVDAGRTAVCDIWGDEWNRGFYPEGKVFCYFGPAWLINYSMKSEDSASVAAAGGWGAVKGPSGFFWGGTWIAAARGTDNPTLAADIMRKMTTDPDIMREIRDRDYDFVNNRPVMEEAAAGEGYAVPVLGNQNPAGVFIESADDAGRAPGSAYDAVCSEEYRKAMRSWFEGSADRDTALEQYRAAVKERCPELAETESASSEVSSSEETSSEETASEETSSEEASSEEASSSEETSSEETAPEETASEETE